MKDSLEAAPAAAATTHPLESFLTCTVCNQYFDDPHVLPCYHRFCKRCLSTSGRCALCRQPYYPKDVGQRDTVLSSTVSRFCEVIAASRVISSADLTAAPAGALTAMAHEHLGMGAAESAESHALSQALEAAAAAGMRLAQLRRPRECFGRYALVFEEYIGSLRETLKASFSTDTTWILGKGKGEKGVERGSELAAWEAAVGTSAFKKGVFRNSLRTRLLSRTHVSYAGDEREAQDLNGVSAEFFSAVWTQLFASVVGAGDEPDDDTAPRDQREWPLFERGGDEGRLLPYLPPAGRANAAAWCATEAGQRHLTRLRLAGTALLKCLLDGY